MKDYYEIWKFLLSEEYTVRNILCVGSKFIDKASPRRR